MTKFKIVIAGFLAVSLLACKKENLDAVPPTDLLDGTGFATPQRTLQEVNGMYAAVKTGQFLAGRYMVYNDVRGEDFLNGTSNGVTAFQTFNFTLSPTTNEVQNLWGAGYAAINRCNVVLQGIETALIDNAQKTIYRGEAQFLRALSYFSLAVLYARPPWDAAGDQYGLILRLTPEADINAASNQKARSTVTATYAQIIKDLNDAETNLPLTQGSSSATGNSVLNVTRAHRNTAIALKTRVYLYMRNYAAVITEANKIVPVAPPFQAPTGVMHRLEPSIANVFTPPYTTLENILSAPFSQLDLPGTQNGLGSYHNPSPFGLGDYYLNSAGIMADASWTAADARKAFNQVAGTRTYVRKWPLTPHTDWAPVMRYSEVLLNLAEALARTNGLDVRAIALLNAVRKRSDAAVTLTPLTANDLIDWILRERRIELLGEGLRGLDVVRLGATFAAKTGAPTVAPNSPQYIWPIPLSERIVNKVAIQNPGY